MGVPTTNKDVKWFCAPPSQAFAHINDEDDHSYTDNATGIKYNVMCDMAQKIVISAGAALSALVMVAY